MMPEHQDPLGLCHRYRSSTASPLSPEPVLMGMGKKLCQEAEKVAGGGGELVVVVVVVVVVVHSPSYSPQPHACPSYGLLNLWGSAWRIPWLYDTSHDLCHNSSHVFPPGPRRGRGYTPDRGCRRGGQNDDGVDGGGGDDDDDSISGRGQSHLGV